MAPRTLAATSTARWLGAIFGVDPRALAAMRMGLAGLTLVDLALRSGDLSAFYTDAGVLPRDLARALAPAGTLSIYFLAPPLSARLVERGDRIHRGHLNHHPCRGDGNDPPRH